MRRSLYVKSEIVEVTDCFGILQRVLIIDFSNLMHRTIYSAVKDDKYCSNNYSLWKSYMLIGKNGYDGIFGLILKHKPDRVVIALDERVSWRKKVYPEYKAHRALLRRKSKVNYEEFFPVSEAFLTELRAIFGNLLFFNLHDCEADDIIAVLTKYIHTNSECIVASNDKDFHQLLSLKHCKQFDPLNKKFVICPNPELELQIKIITGDKNDNITGMQYGVGPVKAENILNEGLDKYLKENNLMEKYSLNKQLIDFNYIPDEVKNSIINTYKEMKVTKIDQKNFFNFFIKNKLTGIAADFGIYTRVLENLR